MLPVQETNQGSLKLASYILYHLSCGLHDVYTNTILKRLIFKIDQVTEVNTNRYGHDAYMNELDMWSSHMTLALLKFLAGSFNW